MNYPADVALDTSGTYSCELACYLSNTNIPIPYLGNVYIADTLNSRIRKVTVSTGIITTYAGNGGSGDYSGDNGPATSAALYYPQGVALDSAGTHSLSRSFFSIQIIT